MTEAGRSVAWILGAGFSFPLGGPLLPRLLSLTSFGDADLRFKEEIAPWRNAAFYACCLFHYGRRFENGFLPDLGRAAPTGELLWEDAEDYLDQLDAAARSKTTPVRIKRGLAAIAGHINKNMPPTSVEILDAARRLVALECSWFVRDGHPSLERWSAHYLWFCALNSNHALITFNYDRVIERLYEEQLTHGGNSNLVPVLPHTDTDLYKSGLPLFKLHGSVDWQRIYEPNGAVRYLENKDPNFVFTAKKNEIGIAMPGPAKKETTSELVSVWKGAEHAIENADAVVFVGYRFPESDSIARERLLGAIQKAATKDRFRMHIVLGVKSPDDTRRLTALLSAAGERAGATYVGDARMHGHSETPRFSVTVHPMYSQDFFSVYREAMLLP